MLKELFLKLTQKSKAAGIPNQTTKHDEGSRAGCDPSPSLSYGWLLFILCIVILITLWPLRNIWLIVNDDLKAANAALAGGLEQFLSMLWALTRQYGRMHFFKIFSYYIPFAFDNFIYFKTIMMTALVGNLLLFSYFLKLFFRSQRVFYLTLLLSLVGMQISWEHNAIVSFAGLHTISLVYLLLAFITYVHYLRKGNRYCLWSGVAFYALALFPYEMFLIYAPVFFLLGIWEKYSWRESLRKMVPYIICLAIFFISYILFYHFRTETYQGTSVNPEFHLERVLRVIGQFSISSIPGYFYFSSKYQYLIHAYQDITTQGHLFGSLQVSWIIRAILVAVTCWVLIERRDLDKLNLNRSYGLLLLVGIFYFFSPSFLLALTEHYQQSVITGGQLGMQVSHYSYFGFLWLAVLLLLAFSKLYNHLIMRRLLLSGLVALIIFISLAVDFTNHYIGNEQAIAARRWKLIDQFLDSYAYTQIPEGSVIYAPSLFQPVATLSFAGQAIDPVPSSAKDLYANYWHFYFNYRGKKAVTVLDSSARIPDTLTGYYYLKYISDANSQSDSLVFCKIIPRPALYPSGLMLCDRASVYDLSNRTSLIVGGAVQTNGMPATVSIENGDWLDTNGIFLLQADNRSIARHKNLKELVLTSSKEAIKADSIFVASGHIPPLSAGTQLELTKLMGWYGDYWIGPLATARIQIQGPKNLVIDGYFPKDIFEMLEWDVLKIVVRVDGNPIKTLSINSGREFRIEQTLSAGSHTLSIESDRSFVPLEEALSQDHRKLSVLITRIEMD